jgi:outer membrane receptor for monomeric catechols
VAVPVPVQVAMRLGAVAARDRDVELGIAPHAVLGDVEALGLDGLLDADAPEPLHRPEAGEREREGEGADGNPLSAGAATSDLKPEETVNYELGTKWDMFHDRLSLTAAVFRTEKKNTRILVDALTYENGGESRVDGLELSASGKLTDQWQVFAGYSYLKSELVDPGLNGRNGVVSAGSNKGNQMPNTPNISSVRHDSPTSATTISCGSIADRAPSPSQ